MDFIHTDIPQAHPQRAREILATHPEVRELFALNVGYHNEHHDFAGIPWNRLPRLTRLAPEHYDSLTSYRSWAGLLARFIRDPSLTLYSRMTREMRATRSG